MPQNLIIEKIKDVAPGQILSFYGFYLLQRESSYCFYKNNKNFFLFVFMAENGEVKFLETVEFKIFDKISLFYFFSEKLDSDSLLLNVKSVIAVDAWDKFNFTESIDPKRLRDSFLRLEKTDYLKGTALENYAYRRDGFDVLLFKDEFNKTVDLVTFIENEEDAISEFGNNFGLHYIEKESNKEQVLLTYHPDFLFDDRYKNLSCVLTKYNVSLFDLISFLRKKSITELVIPLDGLMSYSYKLNLLLRFFNYYNTKVKYDLTVSSNNFFVELSFSLHGDKADKLEMFNMVSGFENEIKKMFSDEPDYVKEAIYDFYNFKIDIISEGSIHSGKIVFRNNKTMVRIVINSIKDYLNGLEKNSYNFV